MIVVKRKDAEKNYTPSNQPTAKNWEFSLLWHGGKAKKTKGIQGPFTCLNRTPRGAEALYPLITLKKGTMEYYILDGTFVCNRKVFKKGDYVIFKKAAKMKWSSKQGGEMLIVLKGELTWHD